MTLGNRWKARPVGSALLRALIFVIPIAVAFLVTALLAAVLPAPEGTAATVTWWVLVLGGSLVALFIAERSVRRLGPLAVLLRMSMAFPGRAPSRFRVARDSGHPRELRERFEQARRDGRADAETVAGTVLALASALSVHDRPTRGHSERTRVFTDMLAEELKLSMGDRDRLRWAALLHDIGKLEVPARILNKREELDEEEWEILHLHPEVGARFIKPLVPWLGVWADTVDQHHEWWNGSGYPTGLRGQEISLGARIVAVADCYDTMTAARPYRKALSAPAARQEVARSAGEQFDPVVVRALLNMSIGRLWWKLGALSWLAQIPGVGRVAQLMGQATTVDQSAIAAAKVAAAVATISVAGALAPLGSPVRDARAEAPVQRDDTDQTAGVTTSGGSGTEAVTGGEGQAQDHRGRGPKREGKGKDKAKGDPGHGNDDVEPGSQSGEHGGSPPDAAQGAGSDDTGSPGTGTHGAGSVESGSSDHGAGSGP